MNKSVIILIVIIATTFAIFSLRHPKEKSSESKEQTRTEATNINPPSSLATPLPVDVSNNIQKAEVPNTPSTLFSTTGKTPQEIITEKNNKSQDFYGKVVDQYGQPISNVDVSGTLITETDVGFNKEAYSTKTDLDGLFEFISLRGADLNITVAKKGYYMDGRGGGYQAPVGGKSSSNNRAVLTMWKIQGAASLKNLTVTAKIPYDGTPAIFDTVSGKESSEGDLKIALSRFPLEVKRGLVHPYDWRIIVEIPQGGILEENDAYPYWAPDGNYQTAFDFEISSNSVPWKNQLEQNFYIKNSLGQYGLMKLVVYSATTPPQIQLNFTINPTGSQNLEPDLSK